MGPSLAYQKKTEQLKLQKGRSSERKVKSKSQRKNALKRGPIHKRVRRQSDPSEVGSKSGQRHEYVNSLLENHHKMEPCTRSGTKARRRNSVEVTVPQPSPQSCSLPVIRSPSPSRLTCDTSSKLRFKPK